jgi:hypothetical protein
MASSRAPYTSSGAPGAAIAWSGAGVCAAAAAGASFRRDFKIAKGMNWADRLGR